MELFGPFTLIRSLGKGGVGEVFVARTQWAEKPIVALKRLLLKPSSISSMRERFRHETELAVRLDHRNLVRAHDAGVVSGQPYMASELVLGKSVGEIADRLQQRGQGGPAAVAVQILADQLAGLAYVHNAQDDSGRPLNLVHRDVTPSNILLGYDGTTRLTDFGLAKSYFSASHQLTVPGEVLGTPNYLAPELLSGDSASPASDIYSLGAVMYRFLTGHPLYQGSRQEVLVDLLSEKPTPLFELRPDLPSSLTAFVHWMISRDPSQRPTDAESLHKELTSEARGSGLLMPKAYVSHWLASLFEEERKEELEEYERLLRVQPPAGKSVRPRSLPRFASRISNHLDQISDDAAAPIWGEEDQTKAVRPPTDPKALETLERIEPADRYPSIETVAVHPGVSLSEVLDRPTTPGFNNAPLEEPDSIMSAVVRPVTNPDDNPLSNAEEALAILESLADDTIASDQNEALANEVRTLQEGGLDSKAPAAKKPVVNTFADTRMDLAQDTRPPSAPFEPAQRPPTSTSAQVQASPSTPNWRAALLAGAIGMLLGIALSAGAGLILLRYSPRATDTQTLAVRLLRLERAQESSAGALKLGGAITRTRAMLLQGQRNQAREEIERMEAQIRNAQP